MMNDRLEELKRKAVAEADVSHIDFDNMSQTDIRMLGDIAVEKKFAELIVRECAEYIEQAKNDTFKDIQDAQRMSLFVKVTKNNMLKHFGVEE